MNVMFIGWRKGQGRKVSSLGREVLVTLGLGFTHSYHFLLPSHWMPAHAPSPASADTRTQVVNHWPRSFDTSTFQGCQPFPSSGTHIAEATARETTDTRLLDIRKQVPASSGHKSQGAALPGQCKPIAFIWSWQKYWASNPLFIVNEPQTITQECSKDVANSITPQGS